MLVPFYTTLWKLHLGPPKNNIPHGTFWVLPDSVSFVLSQKLLIPTFASWKNERVHIISRAWVSSCWADCSIWHNNTLFFFMYLQFELSYTLTYADYSSSLLKATYVARGGKTSALCWLDLYLHSFARQLQTCVQISFRFELFDRENCIASLSFLLIILESF